MSSKSPTSPTITRRVLRIAQRGQSTARGDEELGWQTRPHWWHLAIQKLLRFTTVVKKATGATSFQICRELEPIAVSDKQTRRAIPRKQT